MEERELIKDLREHIKKWVDSHPEWQLDKSNGTYGTDEFTLKLVLRKLSPSGYGTKRMRDEWNKYAEVYGLNPEWLDADFLINHTLYRVVGLDMGRPKNCVQIARLPDGQLQICPPRTLIIGMERTKASSAPKDPLLELP